MSVAHDLRDAIKRKINEKIAGMSDGVARGTLVTFESYKFETGKIAGLKHARDLVDEVFKNLLNEEPDGD